MEIGRWKSCSNCVALVTIKTKSCKRLKKKKLLTQNQEQKNKRMIKLIKITK